VKADVKKWICGTLANNQFDIDRAASAAHAFRNDPKHPEYQYDRVAHVGENWLAAAAFNHWYYPQSYWLAVHVYQGIKRIVPGYWDPRGQYSPEALDAGLDGHEHQNDTSSDLKEACNEN
jgi:hypothetical protein